IALGFALQTAVSLATFTLRAGIGISSHDVLSLISNGGYDCAVLIWLGTMYARKPVHHFEHRVQSWDVDSWNRALLDLLRRDRKSTRLNSSHVAISYAVFCLKKKIEMRFFLRCANDTSISTLDCST